MNGLANMEKINHWNTSAGGNSLWVLSSGFPMNIPTGNVFVKLEVVVGLAYHQLLVKTCILRNRWLLSFLNFELKAILKK